VEEFKRLNKMSEGISVIVIVELVLGLPLSILSGILTLYYAPLPDNLRWFISGAFLAFLPMALVLVIIVARLMRKPIVFP
jgi:hypothetical protein